MEVSLDRIRSILSSHDRRRIDDPSLRKAAVLILLYPREGKLNLLFTKRTSAVEHHKGQISLPGGSADAGDGSLVNTALRETREEIGLDSSRIEILGLYHDQWTPTGFSITPVVGYLPSLPPLFPNHDEVEEIIEIPVSFFLEPSNEQVRFRERSGQQLPVYSYRYREHEVWGATAAIVRSFLADVARNSQPGGSLNSLNEKNPLEFT